MNKVVNWVEFKKGLLWHELFWDWPISGVAIFENEKVYFHMLEEDDDGINRKFGIYKLPDDIWKHIDVRHDSFCEHVGGHCNYVDGKRSHNLLKDRSGWFNFYDKYKDDPEIDFSVCELIGVVDSSLD